MVTSTRTRSFVAGRVSLMAASSVDRLSGLVLRRRVPPGDDTIAATAVRRVELAHELGHGLGEAVGEALEIGGPREGDLGLDGEGQQPLALGLGGLAHAGDVADHA